MKCEDARRRLLADAWDRGASRHLESCAACFEALESADSLTGVLRAAQPDDVPAPAGLADAVLARRPGRDLRPIVVAAAIVVLVVAAAALDLLAGVVPAWVGTAFAGVAGGLAPLVTLRDILLGQPALFASFTAATLGLCGLWLRLALRPPAWRIAR